MVAVDEIATRLTTAALSSEIRHEDALRLTTAFNEDTMELAKSGLLVLLLRGRGWHSAILVQYQKSTYMGETPMQLVISDSLQAKFGAR